MINTTNHISKATPVDTVIHLQATLTMEDLLTILTVDTMAALDTLSTMAILAIMVILAILVILATLVIQATLAILATLLIPTDIILPIMEEEDILTLLKTNKQLAHMHHLAQVMLKRLLLRLLWLITRRLMRNI